MKAHAAITGILLGAISAHVYAYSPNLEVCHFHFSEDQPRDSEAASHLKFVRTGGPVRVCSSQDGGRAYFAASEIFRADEIHYFYLERVYLERDSKGELGWTHLPSQPRLFQQHRYAFMAAGDIGNLRQDNPAFVKTSGVSIGVFDAIRRSWNEWIDSTDAFLEASSELSISQKWLGDYRSFRAALKDGTFQSDSLHSVAFIHWRGASPPRYQLSVHDGDRYWQIDVDVGPDHLKIFSISDEGE